MTSANVFVNSLMLVGKWFKGDSGAKGGRSKNKRAVGAKDCRRQAAPRGHGLPPMPADGHDEANPLPDGKYGKRPTRKRCTGQ